MSFEKWGESSRTQSSNCSAIIHNDITNQAIALSSGDFKPVSALHRGPCVDVRAHLTVLGAFLALFCTFGQMNTFGTFQTWYASHQLQSMPPSTISWIGSLQLWVFFVSVCPCRVLSLYIFPLNYNIENPGSSNRTCFWLIWADCANDGGFCHLRCESYANEHLYPILSILAISRGFFRTRRWSPVCWIQNACSGCE